MNPPMHPQVPNLSLSKLLGSIVCTPPAATAGQSVRVEVRGPDGKAYENQESTPISINGVPGSTQYLTWNFAGAHTLTAIAHRRGFMEKLSTTIQVAKPADGKQPPSLSVLWRPDRPAVAEFNILLAPPPQRRGNPSKLTAVQAAQPISIRTKPLARRLANVTTRPKLKVRPAGDRGMAGGGTHTTTYEWDFGDGIQLGTVMPSFAHDYGLRLDARHIYQMFQVAVTIHGSDGKQTTLRRTITVHNPYVAMKRRGILQPPVAEADLSAQYLSSRVMSRAGYHAKISVRNPESFDLTLSKRHIERIYGDERRFSEMLAPEAVNVVLKANSVTGISVFVTNNLLPKNILGFIAHYSGKGPNGEKVRVSAHFDLPQHLPTHFTLSPALSNALAKLTAREVVSDPRNVGIGELKQFAIQGILEPAALSTLNVKPPVVLMDHKEPAHAVEGEECDPWNLPAVIPNDMFCMPTSELRQVKLPPRFRTPRRAT